MADKPTPIFRPLNADDPQPEATQLESLCMNCHENGTTRLLLAKIPFYKEVVVSSFDCDHCGYTNSEIMSGAKIEEEGILITLRVEQEVDLNRTVCRSDFSCIKIPDLDFEIPARSQKGGITSVEGVLDRSIDGLLQDQDARKEQHPEAAEQIQTFVERLKNLKDGAPFTFVLEDISGNAFVSNPAAPSKDERCSVTHFTRSKAQNEAVGVYKEEAAEKEKVEEAGLMKPMPAEDYSYENLIQNVMQFPTNCPECSALCDTNMKMTKIPFFKEVIIMSTNCEACGNRTNEVKSGGGIEPKGMKVVIDISNPADFTRDILKSETCSIEIPDLDLEVGPRALGGRFTTIEGLLIAMKDQICESNAMFADSRDPEDKIRLDVFLKKFEDLISGSKFTLILDDPAGNSYVQSMADSGADPGMVISYYERSEEQNDDLGLTHMKTENYEES